MLFLPSMTHTQHNTPQALQQVNNFSAINCSNTLWAFASLRHYSAPLFEALMTRLVEQHLDEVEPQNVANALYALARVNHPLGAQTGRLLVGCAVLLWGCALTAVCRQRFASVGSCVLASHPQ